MSIILFVASINGERLGAVAMEPADPLSELLRRAAELTDVGASCAAASSCFKLLHGVQELEARGQSTVGAAGLQSGTELTLVRVAVPTVRLESGSHGWSNEPGQQGEPLSGEIAAVVTSVVEGTERGVTRQCLKSAKPYKIHFCSQREVTSAVRTVEKEAHIIAIMHRMTGPRPGRRDAVIDVQISHGPGTRGGNSTFFLFEGGYPNGGTCFADVHAPWGTCYTDIPRGGSTIIEIPWDDAPSAVTVPGSDIPLFRFDYGPQVWTNTVGEEGPPLRLGELAALMTSVEEGTALGVTRQCFKSSKKYKIHFCEGPEVASRVRTVEIEDGVIAVLHRKTGGRPGRPGAVIDARITYGDGTAGGRSAFVVFEGGYPEGGGCYADVHAPWGTCYTDIPPGGSTIIEVSLDDVMPDNDI